MDTPSEETLALADTEEHVPPTFDEAELPTLTMSQDAILASTRSEPQLASAEAHPEAIEDDTPTVEEARPSTEKRPRDRLWRWCKRLFWTGLVLSLLGLAGVVGLFWHVGRDLPPLRSLSMYKPWRITRIYDINQQIVMRLSEQRRKVVPYQKLPKHVIQAFVAAEDGDFFHHKGFDYTGIMRAFWKNLWRRKGAPKQGGSTITQQVVKTFLLTKQQTYTRKIKEAILSWRLERHLRKWEILYLYLNQIDFGRGNFGIDEAARYYFGKPSTKLTINEAAILAGIPKHPEKYNPANSIPLTRRRRNYVLRMMRRLGHLSQAAYQRELKRPIKTPPPRMKPPFQRDYYTEAVRQEALRRIMDYLRRRRGLKPGKALRKAAHRMLYRGGLRINTALDPKAQRLAVNALRKGLRSLDRHQGFRGPVGRLPRKSWAAFLRKPQQPSPYLKALVMGQDSDGYVLALPTHKGRLSWKDMGWAATRVPARQRRSHLQSLLHPGDLIWVSPHAPNDPADKAPLRPYQLEQIPQVQGALMAIDPRGHQVRALVGGWDINTHPFNRALLARRQPGSAFKPIVAAAGIASHKLTAATQLLDGPVKLRVNGKLWRPTNSSGTFSHKMISLREGLARSLNSIAIRALDITTPYRAIAMARRLGIRDRLTLKPSLALGASVVQPLALTNAYATFAARGAHDQPIMLTRILSHNGETIYERLPSIKRAISPAVAYIVTSMLQDVVKRGTAKAALALKRPIAGKTGTTNKARDAWFIGYTPTICVGVWLGHDDQRPIGRGVSGGQSALPIFNDWMHHYHKRADGSQAAPIPFRVPAEGLLHVEIDPATGQLAPPQQDDSYTEVFLPGTQPTQYANNLGPVANPREFYKDP